MAEPGKRNRVSPWTRHSAIGIQFAFAIVICTYGGNWLEQRYGFAPWGTVVGAGLGFLGGTFSLYHAIYQKREEPEECPRDSERDRGDES